MLSGITVSRIVTNCNCSGLSLVVVAEWYNSGVMQKIKFFDDNTQLHWLPHTVRVNG